MTKKEIINKLNGLCYVQIVRLWNEYVEDKNLPDKKVFLNTPEFFNDMFVAPFDAVIAIIEGQYDRFDVFVAFDSNSHLVTFMFWDDDESPIDADALADWLLDNEVVAMEYGIEDKVMY
ncbi:hypothetical protein [Mitsuokella jalaludinii]|uniref:hypothetical protein n=1 Tax=Mitsuokella jalaludinii TaxID=187979 RepID=UPI003078CFF3